MKSTITQTDIDILSKAFFGNAKSQIIGDKKLNKDSAHDAVIDLNQGKRTIEGLKREVWQYISNSDGSLRWVFKRKDKRPHFLDFYMVSGWRSWLYVCAVKILFLLGLKRLIIQGQFSIYYKDVLYAHQYMTDDKHDGFSVFTGTVGPNRKIVLALRKGSKHTHFVKIPVTERSANMVDHEVEMLQHMQQLNLNKMITPKAIKKGAVGIFSKLSGQLFGRVLHLGRQHIEALTELHNATQHTQSLSESTFSADIETRVRSLKQGSLVHRSDELLNNIKEKWSTIDKTQKVNWSLAHGDFTPWNMFVSQNTLQVYDWELAENQKPALYDLFHFVFQSGILVLHESFDSIYRKILTITEEPDIKALIQNNTIDVNQNLLLYVLDVSSYYLGVYQEQEKVHLQVAWLMDVWVKALQVLGSPRLEQNQRDVFIREVFPRFSNNKYAILKQLGSSLEGLEEAADIDLFSDKHNTSEMLKLCMNHKLVSKLKIRRRSYMTVAELFFRDGGYLSIDFIHQFKRKHLSYIDPALLTRNMSADKNGLKYASSLANLHYIYLFYTLNHSEVPRRYQNWFKRLPEVEKSNLMEAWNNYYETETDMEALFNYTHEKRISWINLIKKQRNNRGFFGIKNQLFYGIDHIKSMFQPSGFVISFSGVDGAGKSTVIEAVSARLEKQFRRQVVVLRHRPSVLPILSAYKYGKEQAEQRSMSSLPRTGNNNSVLSSLLRFAYYYADYLVGQLVVYSKYLVNNKIVLYDRYYFDFINDNRRTNLVLPPGLARLLFRFVNKPHLNVFLYADPDIIVKRKQELSTENIVALTQGYKELFTDFDSKYRKSSYVQIENVHLEHTVEKIMHQFSLSV